MVGAVGFEPTTLSSQTLQHQVLMNCNPVLYKNYAPSACTPAGLDTEQSRVKSMVQCTAEDILILMRLPMSESEKADLLRHLIAPLSGAPPSTHDT